MKKGKDYIGVTASYFCHDGNGNYLFQKRGPACRDEHGRWDNGGGAVEFGDSVLDTIRKEIREEYGTDALEHEFLGYRDVFREQEGVKTHWISLDFKVRIDSAEARNAEPHKFTDIGWFQLDKLPEPLHSQLPLALKNYEGRL